jgi:cytochrome bd-type quinol oxidase subunit 2
MLVVIVPAATAWLFEVANAGQLMSRLPAAAVPSALYTVPCTVVVETCDQPAASRSTSNAPTRTFKIRHPALFIRSPLINAFSCIALSVLPLALARTSLLLSKLLDKHLSQALLFRLVLRVLFLLKYFHQAEQPPRVGQASCLCLLHVRAHNLLRCIRNLLDRLFVQLSVLISFAAMRTCALAALSGYRFS